MLQPPMIPQQMQMPSPWVAMPAQVPQQLSPGELQQLQMQQMQPQNPMLSYLSPSEAAAKAEAARAAFNYKPKPTPTPKPVDTSAKTLEQRMIDNVRNFQKGKRR